MVYHTVKGGFEFLPSVEVKKKDEEDNPAFSGMNDVGSYATFYCSGAELDDNGEVTKLHHGDLKRVYHSLLFGVLLLGTAKKTLKS